MRLLKIGSSYTCLKSYIIRIVLDGIEDDHPRTCLQDANPTFPYLKVAPTAMGPS